MSLLQQQAAQIILNHHGVGGSKAITGTSKVSPPTGYYFCAIFAAEDTVVASQENVTGATNATLAKIPSGATVYGKFASVTLTSGSGIGYLATL